MDKEMQHYRGNMQDKKEGCFIEEKVTNRRDGWPQTTALSKSSNGLMQNFGKLTYKCQYFNATLLCEETLNTHKGTKRPSFGIYAAHKENSTCQGSRAWRCS
jgi:hypothetical protein